MIAAIRVRGDVDVDQNVSRTLQDLNLTKRNQLVVFKENDAIKGMLKNSKDYITFGEISDDIVEELAERAGEDDLESGDTVSLSPPTGGFKNTRKQFGQGGSLGKRDKMDELVQKMV